MDSFIPYWNQFTLLLQSGDFWVAVSFIGLIALAIYFRAPRRITAVLDEQRSAIAREVDEAGRLYEEARLLLARHEAKLASLERESNDFMRAALQKAKDYGAEHEQVLVEKIARQERMAEKRINSAREEAIASLHREAAVLGLRAAEKLVSRNADQVRLTERALIEIENGLQRGLQRKLREYQEH